MSFAEFKIGLSELYQGEVIGEVFFYRMLQHFRSADQQYKLASLLQLETETKARLRPAVMKLGLEVVELDASREQGEAFSRSFDGMDWQAAMSNLASVTTPYVERYAEIAALAPAEYAELANAMAEHERSINAFAKDEISGKSEQSIEPIVKQLVFPLPKI